MENYEVNISKIKIGRIAVVLIIFYLSGFVYGDNVSQNKEEKNRINGVEQKSIEVNNAESIESKQQDPAKKNFNNLKKERQPEEQKKPEIIGTKVRRYAPIEQVRAPMTGKPSLHPMIDLKPRSLRDAFTQPLTLGSEAEGFVAPDWKQPFKDVKADRMQRELETGRTVLQGNVRLRLGELLFESDHFLYEGDAEKVEAEGNVRIIQKDSLLQANKVIYQTPPKEEIISAPSILKPVLDEEELARKRLTTGRLYAEFLSIKDPYRDFSADQIEYDFLKKTGEMKNAKGMVGPFYFHAGALHLHGEDSFTAEDVWLTTCDHDPPHYRVKVKKLVVEESKFKEAEFLRLQIGRVTTPIFFPFWGGEGFLSGFDIDMGRESGIGSYLNVGYLRSITNRVQLGPRMMITEKEGVGFGGDAYYDFMEDPTSFFYRTKGEVHGLYTTEERGYIHLKHRFEPSDDLTLLAQVEHWSDEEFYKDFFYKTYRDRTEPRSFVNVTYRQPEYIATATTRVGTHGWVHETERLPEATFHWLEQPLFSNVYLSFDTLNGYNRREPYDYEAFRTVNILRLTYDAPSLGPIKVTPFAESQLTWYSEQSNGDESIGGLSEKLGVTLQTRLIRVYGGFLGFSAIKHVVLPSLTLSYRTPSAYNIRDRYYFDPLDTVTGQTRIETKLDNVFYGKDEESQEVWQIARLTLYQGNDFWNEYHKSDDYEIEMDIRPRKWYGLQLVAEKHVSEEIKWYKQERKVNRLSIYDWMERWLDEKEGRYSSYLEISDLISGDYTRVLGTLYFDNTLVGGRANGRVGFMLAETENEVVNRDILYGLGYRLSDKWSVAFEHIYDLENDNLRRQMYEIRRNLHCWDMGLRWTERERGTDISIEFSLTAFPGTRVRF